MNLEELSIEELEKEIERRKEIAKKQAMPKPLANPDWSKVITFAQQLVELRSDPDYYEDDDPHYMYEEVMRAVFGPDIWKWWNEQ